MTSKRRKVWRHEDEHGFPTSWDGVGDVVAIGGELTPERLRVAYGRGIFPWYQEGAPVLWWCPDPRAVIELDALYVSRRLARTIRSGRFRITFDADFPAVIQACRDVHTDGVWITEEMMEGFVGLHRDGHAHSVEAWLDDRLVGGAYGVVAGGLFAGESMFHTVSDASKVALHHLFTRLRRNGFVLFDLQILNEHTERLGGYEVSRREYLKRLERAVPLPVTF